MYGKIGQFYNVAGGRKNKEDRLNQERPSGRNLKENNGHDLGGHGRRRKQTQKVLMSKSQGRSDTEPGDEKTWKKKKNRKSYKTPVLSSRLRNLALIYSGSTVKFPPGK